MRGLQPSFARGELSPVLHARVDLAFYNIGLAGLKNFIVLPQGGVTRRPGFSRLGAALSSSGEECPVSLLPFAYSREDSMVVEMGDGYARVWRPSTGEAVATVATPYSSGDLKTLKWVQSGNVIFLAHRSHPVMMLRRLSLGSWSLGAFEGKKGPWLSDSGGDGVDLSASPSGAAYQISATAGFFASDMAGRLLEMSYTVRSNSASGSSAPAPNWSASAAVEVGSQWYLRTYGGWRGTVALEKSLDGGGNWIEVREYTRTDPSTQGNIEYAGAEAEENVLYRVLAQHSSNSGAFTFTLEATGYTKKNIFKISAVLSPTAALAEWQKDAFEVGSPIAGRPASAWRLGAWGGAAGWPACIAFYQNRFLLAGSREEPQTVWMSKIGEYDNFGVSDPIADDGPITLTLASEDMDGIHSLLAMSDVLAFTGSGEWKISGAGENGALSANAVVAHKQSGIGSAPIQPAVVGGQAVMVQSHGTQVHSIEYLFEFDGYRGSHISLLSDHIFSWKLGEGEAPADRRIRRMAYQQVPDSLLWFALEDGTAATCTLHPEHQVIAWGRQETAGRIGDVACVPNGDHSELWAAVERGGEWGIERLAPRGQESLFLDAGAHGYESSLETLRVNLDSQGGSMMAAKKFIPRLAVFALRSKRAWVAPKSDKGRSRARRVSWAYSPEMAEAEIQLDSGFERNAGVQVWADGQEPLTILALSPTVAVGG